MNCRNLWNVIPVISVGGNRSHLEIRKEERFLMILLLSILRKLGTHSPRVLLLWRRLSLPFFNRTCSHIYKTPPITMAENGFALATMLQHVDVVQYLTAIKSFCQFVTAPAQVHIVNDGSLTDEDIRQLKHHVPGVHIEHIENIDTGACPKGSCWERLKYVVDLSQSIYVVQMDADTFCRTALPEVNQAIKRNRSFLLGTDMGHAPIPTHQASDFAASLPLSHVQLHSEIELKNLDVADQKYMRACAGFAGFAKGATNWQSVERFSSQMEKLVVDERWSWNTWGTEQVTSNFVLANTEEPVALVEPDYLNYFGRPGSEDARFFHFLGESRFENDFYRQLALGFIEDLGVV